MSLKHKSKWDVITCICLQEGTYMGCLYDTIWETLKSIYAEVAEAVRSRKKSDKFVIF